MQRRVEIVLVDPLKLPVGIAEANGTCSGRSVEAGDGRSEWNLLLAIR